VIRPQSGVRLGGPLGVSAVLHASIIAAAIFARPAPPKALPPVYKVSLIAAPPGPRAIGEVTPQPAPAPPPTPAPPPPRAETNPRDMPAPTKPKLAAKKAAAPATPTVAKKAAPKDEPQDRKSVV